MRVAGCGGDVRVAGYRGDVRVAGCGCEGGRV